MSDGMEYSTGAPDTVPLVTTFIEDHRQALEAFSEQRDSINVVHDLLTSENKEAIFDGASEVAADKGIVQVAITGSREQRRQSAKLDPVLDASFDVINAFSMYEVHGKFAGIETLKFEEIFPEVRDILGENFRRDIDYAVQAHTKHMELRTDVEPELHERVTSDPAFRDQLLRWAASLGEGEQDAATESLLYLLSFDRDKQAVEKARPSLVDVLSSHVHDSPIEQYMPMAIEDLLSEGTKHHAAHPELREWVVLLQEALQGEDGPSVAEFLTDGEYELPRPLQKYFSGYKTGVDKFILAVLVSHIDRISPGYEPIPNVDDIKMLWSTLVKKVSANSRRVEVVRTKHEVMRARVHRGRNGGVLPQHSADSGDSEDGAEKEPVANRSFVRLARTGETRYVVASDQADSAKTVEAEIEAFAGTEKDLADFVTRALEQLRTTPRDRQTGVRALKRRVRDADGNEMRLFELKPAAMKGLTGSGRFAQVRVHFSWVVPDSVIGLLAIEWRNDSAKPKFQR